jgi:uncharacterized membrane protein YqaE (UPF0057 family)
MARLQVLFLLTALSAALLPDDAPQDGIVENGMENGLRVNIVDERNRVSSVQYVDQRTFADATRHDSGSFRVSLNRLFALVESERMTARNSPCPAVDQRSALTALLLSIVFPPTAHFYYGFTVLGVVQLLLTLLVYLPLFLACGWWCKPVQRVPRTPMCFENEADEASITRKRIQGRVTALIVAVCVAVVLAAVLLAWQVSMLVRIATNDLQPANGCPPRPL